MHEAGWSNNQCLKNYYKKLKIKSFVASKMFTASCEYLKQLNASRLRPDASSISNTHSPFHFRIEESNWTSGTRVFDMNTIDRV